MHFSYEYHDYLCYCCFNSYSTFFTADIMILLLQNAIAISNLDAADATAQNIFWLINWLTHLRGNFPWESPLCSTALIWDKGVSTNAYDFGDVYSVWAFYAKRNLKILKKHEKVKSQWNEAPSFMTWLPGYKLDEGSHSQQHAVNCVILCLIAKAETVLSLCIDEFLLLYQIIMLPYSSTSWVTVEVFVSV